MADVVAASLVESNLCGHDSHGVVRVPEYVGLLKSGALVSDAEFEVISETDSALVADAKNGFGQIQMTTLIARLSTKADNSGIACGTLKLCGHVGRLGEWVEKVALAGQAALLAVNDNGVLKCVAPPGGVEPRISTNPIAVAVPTDAEPLVLDISTSAVANGKIKVAHNSQVDCPDGWLIDPDGNPTNDPSLRYEDPPATILPMGGDQGYKGFGLGLVFDILIGGLSGGACPPAGDDDPDCNNVLMLIWNPDKFHGSSHFMGESAKLVDYVRSVKRKPGVEAIRLPHDRSRETHQLRSREGIPLDDGTWQALTDTAKSFDL